MSAESVNKRGKKGTGILTLREVVEPGDGMARELFVRAGSESQLSMAESIGKGGRECAPSGASGMWIVSRHAQDVADF